MYWIRTNIIVILATLLAVSLIGNGLQWWSISSLRSDNEKLNVSLGVVAGLSQNQEVKFVESKIIEEKIKLVAQEKIKTVKEYVYDENKSECDNAIDRMRITF